LRSGRLRGTEPEKSAAGLDADEVVRFLAAVPSLKSCAALTAAYTAGLLHLAGQGYYDHDSTGPTR
jgi:hypothetical protein